jgi:hypothetical protein
MVITQSQSEEKSIADYEFDAFLSYSTDPDYRLVRRVEIFLESFHRRLGTANANRLGIKRLRICVDGSDFRPPPTEPSKDTRNPIQREIEARLAASRWLVVFCSRNSMRSTWVDAEIDWFVENRGRQYVKLLVTEGIDPSAEPAAFFSKRVVQERLHANPWIDLREAKASRSSALKVRNIEDGLVTLAASLQVPPHTAGDLLPPWKREQVRQSRRRMIVGVGGAAAALVAAVTGIKLSLDRPKRLVNRAREQLQMAGFATVPVNDDFGSAWRVVPGDKVEMHSSPTNWLDLGPSFETIDRYDGIASIDINYVRVGSIEPLVSLRNVESVSVAGCGLESLAALTEMSKLRSANVSYNPGLTNRGILPLARLRSLEKLDLSSCSAITSDGLACLASLERLKELHLNFCSNVDNDFLRHVAAREMRVLLMKGTNVKVDNRLLDFVHEAPNLRTLSASPTNADPAALQQLQRLANEGNFAFDVTPITGGF